MGILNNMALQAEGNLKPTPGAAHQVLTVADAAVPLGALADATTQVLYQAQGAALRVRWDGTAPTASVGLLLAVNQTGVVSKATAAAMQWIADAIGSGTLLVMELTPTPPRNL